MGRTGKVALTRAGVRDAVPAVRGAATALLPGDCYRARLSGLGSGRAGRITRPGRLAPRRYGGGSVIFLGIVMAGVFFAGVIAGRWVR